MESATDALVSPLGARNRVGFRSRRGQLPRWTKLCAAALTAILLILLGKTCFQEEPDINPVHSRTDVSGTLLWTGEDCDSSSLQLREALHRNLGGFGPDDGEESMVYSLVGENGTEIEMVLIALNEDYRPWHARKMGSRDGIAMVSTMASSRLLANVSFRSSSTRESVELPQLALSFYDMNMKHKVDSKKVVRVFDVRGNWTDAIRSNDSLVSVRQNMSEGSVTFTASKREEGLDPVTDPRDLSLSHFKRSVSVRFSKVRSFKLEMQTGLRDNHQVFQFAPEALLCAAPAEGRPTTTLIPNHWLQEPLERKRGQVALVASESAFQRWFVAEGDIVNEGDPVYSVRKSSGEIQEVPSPTYGQVVQMLSSLMPGDALEPGLKLIVIQKKGRVLWVVLAWVAGFGCAAVLVAVKCCSHYPEKPPPMVLDEDDVVVLEFRTPTGWMQSGVWKHQPLGLGFHKSLPAIVAVVGDEAKHTGVLEGDELVKIGTERHGMRPIADHSYDEFWSELSALVSQLPEVPRLVLEFETTHGRERQLEWITKPLGVSFDDAMPMLVTEVHEEALHLNVRVGDKLTRYGLVEDRNQLQSMEGKTSQEVKSAISNHLAKFPTAMRMICVFELPDHSLREFMWHARPLGISFNSSSPPVVSKVETPADMKGVKEGYILRRFGSDFRMLEATDNKSFNRILADMEKFASLLPDATRQDVEAW